MANPVVIDVTEEEGNERRLATVRTVSRVMPLYDKVGNLANTVEGVFVDGWFSIAQRGQFKVNDPVLYLEIDSILNPNLSWVRNYAAFMEKHKWHLKTLRLNSLRTSDANGEPTPYAPVSQGLVLPMSALYEAQLASLPVTPYDDSTDSYVNDGDMWAHKFAKVFDSVVKADVEAYNKLGLDEILGIVKYARPIKAAIGDAKGDFPTRLGIHKTDEERVQNIGRIIEFFHGKPVVATYKYDGSSTTVWLDEEGVMQIASRNLTKNHDGGNYFSKAVNSQSGIEALLRENPDILAVQGEAIGEGVQKNPHGVSGYKLIVFNLLTRENGFALPFTKMKELCDKYGIAHTVKIMRWDSFDLTVEQCIDFVSTLEVIDFNEVSGKRSKWGEGLVFRLDEEKPGVLPNGVAASFKAINPNYLIDNGE